MTVVFREERESRGEETFQHDGGLPILAKVVTQRGKNTVPGRRNAPFQPLGIDRTTKRPPETD